MLFFVLCLIGLLVQIAFILVERKEKYVLAVILKGSASIIFIIAGIWSMGICQDKTFAKLLVAGLIMGGIGDVCLNLRYLLKEGKKIFLLGVAAFLVGHILYLAALIPQPNNPLAISITVGIIAAALLLKWIFSVITAEKALKIFGIFYIGAVVLMTTVSIGMFICAPSETSRLIYMVGAILFTLSDIILILNMFGDKKPWMRPTNLTLYYLGQLLIAFSMQFIA